MRGRDPAISDRLGARVGRMRRRGLVLALVGCVCLLVCGVATAHAARTPYVFLGGYWIDQHHKYGWSFFTRRPAPPEGSGPHGAQRPCISVAAIRREFREFAVHESEFCYGTPGFLTAKAEPLIVANTVFSIDKGSATAFGVAASPAARRLRLTLEHGRRTIRLHKLNDFQARKARLRPFRYAGFLMRGDWCIERFELLNEAGNSLWDTGSEPCTEEEAPRLRSLGPSRLHSWQIGRVARQWR